MSFSRDRIVIVVGGRRPFYGANLAGEGEVTFVSRSDYFLFTSLHYES
jgi:hypothetical protein